MGVTGNTSSVNSFSDNLTTQGESSPDRGEETSQSIQPSLEPTILITGVCLCVWVCLLVSDGKTVPINSGFPEDETVVRSPSE